MVLAYNLKGVAHMSKINHKAFYTHVFSQWSRELGPVPTNEQLAIAHASVVRGPGLQALAGVACALRECGVSREQQKRISRMYRPGKGTTHCNVIVDMCNDGDAVMLPAPKGVYRIELTAKGRTNVERFTGSTLEGRMTERSAAIKAAAPKKARKPKGDAVDAVDAPVALLTYDAPSA